MAGWLQISNLLLGGALMKLKRVSSFVLAAMLAVFSVVGVFAQTPVEPETVTIPAFNTASIISGAMGIAGVFLSLILTVTVVRLAPKFISGIRRSLGAAAGR